MPHPKPLNYPTKWIFADMEGKAKALPFVVLINSNQIIDSRCPEAASFEPPCLPLLHQIRFIDMKIFNYETSVKGKYGSQRLG